MPYLATVLNVMIASPSDVTEERLILHEVIAEWNAVHANDRSTVLLPLGWETHSVPDMGERPQAIINRQILKNADLLIAVFWTRIGSPTGVWPSGTVEEIEEHIKAGKPTMIYFSSTPAHPNSIEEEQYKALSDFKQSVKKRGLYEEYDGPGQFRAKLGRQLARKLVTSFLSVPPSMEAINYTAPVATISPDATRLLIEASNDRGGTVVNVSTVDQGCIVRTNNRSFVETGNARAEGRWLSAVDELAHAGLIEELGSTNEVFFVSPEGYRVADLFKHAGGPAPL